MEQLLEKWPLTFNLILVSALTTIITAIALHVGRRLKDVLKSNEVLGGKISKVHAENITLKSAINGVLSSILASEKSVWNELLELRRTLASGEVENNGRRRSLGEILGATDRLENKLGLHTKILQAHQEYLKRNLRDHQKYETEIIQLNEDLILIKEKKEKS